MKAAAKARHRSVFLAGWSIFCVIGAAAKCAGAGAPRVVSARVLDYGVYRKDARATETGDDPYVLIRTTDTIEACKGTSFGYHLRVSGVQPSSRVSFKKVVAQPPMRKPSGEIQHGYEIEQTTTAWHDGHVECYQGFTFDHEYEMVPGLWTIAFQYEGRGLASHSFVVVACHGEGAK